MIMDYSELYKTYFPQLVMVASRWLSKEDAEDLVQDVMVRLWVRRDTMKYLTDFFPYALTAVRNRCLDHLKHLTYVREYEHTASANLRMAIDMENPMTRMEYCEFEKKVNMAVSSLPTRCRTVFMMSRYEDKKYDEIATELGISLNTVENHMTSALCKLRNVLLAS